VFDVTFHHRIAPLLCREDERHQRPTASTNVKATDISRRCRSM
jgi:hypothetical protein